MAAQHQRQATDNHNQQVQHGAIVARHWDAIQLGRVLATVRITFRAARPSAFLIHARTPDSAIPASCAAVSR